MDESILNTIKKMLGLDEDYDAFDTDIVMNINSAIMIANQIGVGKKGFSISSFKETWRDFIGDNGNLNSVQMFIYYNTKLGFDPPSNSFLVNAIEKKLDELTWRININAEEVAANE